MSFKVLVTFEKIIKTGAKNLSLGHIYFKETKFFNKNPIEIKKTFVI